MVLTEENVPIYDVDFEDRNFMDIFDDQLKTNIKTKFYEKQ